MKRSSEPVRCTSVNTSRHDFAVWGGCVIPRRQLIAADSWDACDDCLRIDIVDLVFFLRVVEIRFLLRCDAVQCVVRWRDQAQGAVCV
jgi:hypothetical protein